MSEYKAFKVELSDKIAHVQINRPEKLNAMNADFWSEIRDIFAWVEATPEVIKEFDRRTLINENVLRHLIINKEGE